MPIVPIVTIYNDKTKCLSQKASALELTVQGLKEAQDIANQLIETLTPLMPAAGLAAPQIGISKQIFIYTWDRTIENIEVVINPTICHVGKEQYRSWEACFSTMQEDGPSQAAQLFRAQSIEVEYCNLKGECIRLQLDGFAAKVFQHEYDHLQGLENVRKPGAELKTFASEAELTLFMKTVHRTDASGYIKPWPKAKL